MLTETISRSLIDVAFQGTVLLAPIALLMFVLRRRTTPATRHLVWALALLALLGFWLLAPVSPRWQVPWPTSGPTPRGASALAALPDASLPQEPGGVAVAPLVAVPAGASAPPVHTAEPGPDFAATGAAPLRAAARPHWHEVLAAAWLLGVVLMVGSMVRGLLRTRRLMRSARPLPDESTVRGLLGRSPAAARVRLASSPHVAVPMTAGFLRPVILLPAIFADWPLQQRRAVVQHELAHVRRHDWLVRMLARVAVALHWFNPLAWFAERSLWFESECACDEAALAAGDAPADYAQSLLAVARAVRGKPPAAALAMAGSHLERRLRSLLDPRQRSVRGRVARWLAAAATAMSALPLAGLAVSRRPSSDVLTVAADGSARFQSIQQAIDAAPANGTVRIAAGTYREHVTITKPLTLEGTGWQQTILTADYENPLAKPELQQELARLLAGKEPAEQQRARAGFLLAHGPQPTLRIRDAAGVVVKGFQITQPGAMQEGQILPGAIVTIAAAGARLVDCAIVESPACGIDIRGAADVQVENSLIAAVGATGIQIVGQEPKVRIAGCDVRRCVHRGITVSGGNSSTTVEGCRVSGSAWHGIRYDDSAPTITGNLIFANERFGIYSAGKARATVRGNLFFANGMTGISCWPGSQDRIEGNTFVADVRAAIEVLGSAAPTIERNLFFDLKQGVALGNVAGEGEDAKSSGTVELRDNVFWKVEQRAVSRQPGNTEPQLLPAADTGGNRSADPRFADAERRDFRLAAESPLRAAGIGAADVPAFAGPWPELPAEKRIAARQSERQEADAAMWSAQAAYATAKPWIDAIQQIRDKGVRDAAVAEVRAALQSDDGGKKHAALVALTTTMQVSYDRSSLRELVLPLCRTGTGDAQVKAFYALNAVGRQPGDGTLLLAALREPSAAMRSSGTHLLMLFFDRQLMGEAGAAALRLLDTDSANMRREAMRGLWGATASPEIQQRLLAIAALPDSRHDAIYFGLSTLQNKSRAVVEFLLGVLEEPGEDAARALWGLGQGVATTEHVLVADTLVKLIEARNDLYTLQEALRLLERYGTAAELPALRKLAENDLAPQPARAAARRAASAIEKR